jgi:hypothetical protein
MEFGLTHNDHCMLLFYVGSHICMAVLRFTKDRLVAPKIYYSFLVIVSLISLAIVLIIKPAGDPDMFRKGMYAIIAFFVCYSTVMYFLAQKSAHSKNIYLFNRIFIGSIGIKIFLFIVLVFICLKVIHLEPGDLSIPLASIYILFTTFETWYLMKIAKS